MFGSAHEAMAWLREQGYSTPEQVTFTMPELGKGSLVNIEEWALLAYAQDQWEHQLHIYWLRPKPDREAWQHGQYVIFRFTKKYPQIFALFFVKRKDGCWIVCPHSDRNRKSWTNQPRAKMTPDNHALLNALRFDKELSTEALWKRILRVITGEETMHPRIEQAFETFLAELNEILAEAQETIKCKAEEGCFGEIAALSQQAEQVRQLMEEVKTLKGRWARP